MIRFAPEADFDGDHHGANLNKLNASESASNSL